MPLKTLPAFLRVIGEFTGAHSERLDDAFEYLLPVLGVQRRPVERDGLPRTETETGEYLPRLRGEAVAGLTPTLGHVVEKERIVADGD